MRTDFQALGMMAACILLKIKTMKRHFLKSLIGYFLFLACLSTGSADTSRLWGDSGELWNPKSRLPDFSYAGYHRGEAPLPDRKSELNLKDFGAVGDGLSDDTAAFQKAIDASAGKVITVPRGRYRISDILAIRHSETLLKGAGPDQSILLFSAPLNDINPNWGATTSGRRTSNYSWSGGFLQISGTFSDQKAASVIHPAQRGDQALVVSNCGDFNVGEELILRMTDTPGNSLATLLYADDPGALENLKGRSRESFLFQLSKVDPSAGRIEFDRPLRVDVRLEWNPLCRRLV